MLSCVQVFPWNVGDSIVKSCQSQPELEDSREKIIKVFRAEQRDQWLVVCLDLKMAAKDKVGKLFTCPGNCQCFLFNSTYLLSVSVKERKAYATGLQASEDFCRRTAPSPYEEASAATLVEALGS